MSFNELPCFGVIVSSDQRSVWNNWLCHEIWQIKNRSWQCYWNYEIVILTSILTKLFKWGEFKIDDDHCNMMKIKQHQNFIEGKKCWKIKNSKWKWKWTWTLKFSEKKWCKKKQYSQSNFTIINFSFSGRTRVSLLFVHIFAVVLLGQMT